MTVTLDHPTNGVARIIIDRPDRLNALDAPTIAALHDAIDNVETDETSRVVVLTGAGRGFCTGLDLRDGYPQIPHSPEGRLAWMTRVGRLVSRLHHLDQVVVAAVDGPAFGGGFALALGADLRLASERASFCLPQVRFGLSASEMGVGYLLPRIVGASRAAEIMLTGRAVPAEEAERIGLVSSIHSSADLPEAARQLASQLAETPRSGLVATKGLLSAGLQAGGLDQALAAEAQAQALAFCGDHVRHLIETFAQQK